ncbi:vWA domain-containing protein [Pelagicoccus albus]|uniref:VWA domain-containing protein n=1 Tax=Pelagicoccus albus TaxID=415222 RepID=A0A7X1E7J6_9BACT|nr:vWA domain-containing protein [Pelagicoccus albus]MBC2605810.1 VWA domain-containing protein [Pelagicoccus albus]
MLNLPLVPPRNTLVAFAALASLTSPFAIANSQTEQEEDSPANFDSPTMEVVFVLDTTGSMSGLIAGAKQKIWQIADKLKSAKPTPNIRFGLIGYRDRGDDYITRTYPLSDNIDEVYGNLMQFQANGGGDEPESVNQALYEAVSQMQWDSDRSTLKTIFLVGDARPHMDYQDDVKYEVTCELAQAKGILINTIQCGSKSQTASFWRSISDMTNGTYAAIQQQGGTIVVETEWDPVINDLNIQLDSTIIPYGSLKEQSYARKNRSLLAGMSSSAIADRSNYLFKSGKSKVIAGSGDLVEMVMSGKLDYDKIEKDKLPPELQELDTSELKNLIEEKSAQRESIQDEIRDNLARRNAYVEEEMSKFSESDKEEVFELSAFEALEKQAVAAGYSF